MMWLILVAVVAVLIGGLAHANTSPNADTDRS